MLFFVRAGGCGADILKGVYYALVLTVRNPGKISMQVKNKAAVDAPWVCYIQTRLIMPVSHWCILFAPMAT
jgi:hypothetical protein